LQLLRQKLRLWLLLRVGLLVRRLLLLERQLLGQLLEGWLLLLWRRRPDDCSFDSCAAAAFRARNSAARSCSRWNC
jgi:hypothetical protein